MPLSTNCLAFCLQERLTLKHKNSSKWARRALMRGQGAMEPSMREALAAQLALGQQLRARVEGRRGSGSEGGSGDDDRCVRSIIGGCGGVWNLDAGAGVSEALEQLQVVQQLEQLA